MKDESCYYACVASECLLSMPPQAWEQGICSDKINTSCSSAVEWENCQLSLLFPALDFLFTSVLFSPEVNVLLYLHPTQFLVGREGSGRNRLNPILLQTSEGKRRKEKRREEEIQSVNQTIDCSMTTELSNPPITFDPWWLVWLY